MKRPDWILDKLKESEGKSKARDHITIIAMSPISGRSMAGGTPISRSRMTGEGEDQILQPGKVAGDVHEGEMVMSANATQALPEDVRVELVRQAESGALDVNALRSALKIEPKPGYEFGTGGLGASAFNPISKSTLINAVKPVVPPISPSVVKDTKVDVGSTVIGDTLNKLPGYVQSAFPIPQRTLPADQMPTSDSLASLNQPIAQAPTVNIGKVTSVAKDPILNEPDPTPIEKPVVKLGTVTAKANPNTSSLNTTSSNSGTTSNAPGTTTSTSGSDIPAPSANTNIINSSLRRVVDTAEGNSQAERNIANSQLRNFDTRASNELAANEMDLALRNDLPEGLKGSLSAQAQSGIRSSRSELIGDMSAGAAERAAAANVTAANMAASQQAFEEDQKRYKDSADWKAYETAIAAGDFTTAATTYKRVTGNDINMDQMVRYQKYMNTKNEQDLTTGEITIASLRTSLGTQTVDAISGAIGKGMSLSQVNSQFPEARLTLKDYKAMYEATPLGERSWERNMSYAKTLLEAGGADNIAAAAGIFNQAFPGTNINFSNLITADKSGTFNKGMSQLSDFVAAGLDYNEAVAAMKADGTFDMLGMKDTDVEKLYRGMKVNAIDEQWSTITDSEWYKGLPDADKKDMSSFFTAVLSGKLDYSVEKEYTYKDASGATVSKFFNTAKEAADYGTANKVTMTATGKTQVVPRTTTQETTVAKTPTEIALSIRGMAQIDPKIIAIADTLPQKSLAQVNNFTNADQGTLMTVSIGTKRFVGTFENKDAEKALFRLPDGHLLAVFFDNGDYSVENSDNGKVTKNYPLIPNSPAPATTTTPA